MRIIDADKFLTWLIFSKHIEGLICGEVREAFEMCKVDILDKIRAEIEQLPTTTCTETHKIYIDADDFKENVLDILDKYKVESEE
jgi:hypothetical protein